MNENDIIRQLHSDTHLREAVSRREQQLPPIPADLNERVLKRIDTARETSKRRYWPYINAAIAACLLVLFGVGAMVWFNRQEDTVKPIALQQVKPTSIASDTIERTNKAEGKPYTADVQTVQRPCTHRTRPVYKTESDAAEQDRKAVGRTEPAVKDDNLHYASLEAEDTAYQAPSLMDDFIAKLAEYHHIETEVLSDSTAHSVAYVFPDNDKVRLFDRLLQVASSYGYDSPGYRLTISQQQLMFSLEDRRLRQRHLWLAERIGGGRIILYATHAPIGRSVSSECYQNFREKITHTNQTFEL